MTRLEALKAAREFVAELHATKNDRGYPKFTATSDQLLKQELEVADFLLRGQDDDE